MLLKSRKKASVILKIQRIPSDMWDLKSRLIRNPLDCSVKDMKSFHPLTLIASLKQKLQSQTDTKERSSLLCHFTDHLVQLIFFQLSHRISEGSDARKNYFIMTFPNKFSSFLASNFNISITKSMNLMSITSTHTIIYK